MHRQAPKSALDEHAAVAKEQGGTELTPTKHAAANAANPGDVDRTPIEMDRTSEMESWGSNMGHAQGDELPPYDAYVD